MIWRKKELRNIGSKFGAASTKVVIEEFLDGIELSCFVLTDGKVTKYFQQRKITNALAKATLD
jgi:phosphoribosylamine--glycine ligase